MRALVFDAGSVISLTLNNLLWILEPLKKKFQGDFFITPSVKEELFDKPIQTKKFKFEAIQVKELTDKKILEILDEKKELSDMTNRLSFYANNSFQAWGSYIKIVHEGEIQSLALTKIRDADALVVDERNVRMLIEDPESLAAMMKKRLHTYIRVDKENIKKFQQMVQGIKIIRSIELVAIAYEVGMFEKYGVEKKEVLDAVLWGVKLKGCSVSEEEIDQIFTLER